MNKTKLRSVMLSGLAVVSGGAFAADWTFSGLLREEAAIKLSDDQNINNWAGNPYNGVPQKNHFTQQVLGTDSTLTRPADQKKDTGLNMLATRVELNLDGKIDENWAVHFKLRGVTDQVGAVENAFKDKNIFEQSYGRGRSGGPIGSAGKDWMIDLPTAYVDYNNGPAWLRIGNQQIAWGETLFFRVSDVANGLDLRRHSVLDVAAEEFSDKRVSSPAIRTSWRASESSQFEGFVQQFSPSILPSENSPYNTIPAQFIIDQKTAYDKEKDNLNFGMKWQGKFDSVGIQAFAVRRNNPDGVYRWTTATGPNAVGASAFAANSGVGVYSANEWFNYASSVRLDGLGGLETALNEFNTAPLGATGLANACGATGSAGTTTSTGNIKVNSASAACILDGFFSTGDLRGTLAREYPRENVFGFSVNKVFEGEPDSITDQLIGRFELSYTPNKKFTNPTLSRDYLVKDETNFAFVFEKYHKFSNALPATYMVFQWMHKSESDLFGRSLSGNNNLPGSSPVGDSGGSNNLAFVLQQPSPSLEWRFDFAALTDTKGGWLLQPGVKWKLNKSTQLDIYANFLRSSNQGNDFAQGFNYAREVFLRGSLYF